MLGSVRSRRTCCSVCGVMPGSAATTCGAASSTLTVRMLLNTVTNGSTRSTTAGGMPPTSQSSSLCGNGRVARQIGCARGAVVGIFRIVVAGLRRRAPGDDTVGIDRARCPRLTPSAVDQAREQTGFGAALRSTRAASERKVTLTRPAPTRALKVPLVGRVASFCAGQLEGREFDARGDQRLGLQAVWRCRDHDGGVGDVGRGRSAPAPASAARIQSTATTMKPRAIRPAKRADDGCLAPLIAAPPSSALAAAFSRAVRHVAGFLGPRAFRRRRDVRTPSRPRPFSTCPVALSRTVMRMLSGSCDLAAPDRLPRPGPVRHRRRSRGTARGSAPPGRQSGSARRSASAWNGARSRTSASPCASAFSIRRMNLESRPRVGTDARCAQRSPTIRCPRTAAPWRRR